jgi:hypothetical protein
MLRMPKPLLCRKKNLLLQPEMRQRLIPSMIRSRMPFQTPQKPQRH